MHILPRKGKPDSCLRLVLRKGGLIEFMERSIALSVVGFSALCQSGLLHGTFIMLEGHVRLSLMMSYCMCIGGILSYFVPSNPWRSTVAVF